ncbi:CocE/NonD family hydrolase [Deinococcus sp. YIM 134068]|uniref:CocE/NonD family hydrolase n=1 Tax=Deinococcus lichenicola TaxID=3118910 RepID=UPI002F92DC32
MTTPDTRPTPPTRLARVLDTVTTRAMRPPAGSAYTVTRGVWVPMRDGAELLADVYTPVGEVRGTLLVRLPYGRGVLAAANFAAPYAARGYRVVLQSCRGTFGSGGGPFEPMGREIEDGADTATWLRAQPWFGGRFATLGGSYFGFTQWALLLDPPPELVTAVILIGLHDVYQTAHGAGAFRLEVLLSWHHQIARQERGGLLTALIDRAKLTRRLKPALDALPLLEAGERHLGGGPLGASYRDMLTRADLGDPYWTPRRLEGALEQVRVPVLLAGDWQDIFLDQTLAQYARLRERGVDVALTVGPWAHGEGLDVMTREALDWLAEHLGGEARHRSAPVRVSVTGAGEWRDLPGWPPPTGSRTLYLHPDGGLGAYPPSPKARPSTFTYDPASPTPSVGGQLLVNGGYRDTRPLEAREDILTFTGPALTAPLEVMGVPEVEVVHRSDNPHADLFVRLCEVDVRGQSRLVSDGFRRLTPADGGVVRLSLGAVAHRFAAGSRLRVLISGGSHPQYARNLGTGEDPATGRRLAVSHRTVMHGEGGLSRIVLPVTG